MYKSKLEELKYLERIGTAFETVLIKNDVKDLIAAIFDTTFAVSGVPLPITGVLFKSFSIYDKLRDAILIEKAIEFGTEFEKIDTEDREKLIDRINTDPIYGQNFGTFLLSSLDRMDFKIKAKYLARACRYYHLNYINRSNFIRLKSIIENINMSDVERWILYKDPVTDDLYDNTESYGIYFRKPKNESDPTFNAFLNLGIIYRKFDFSSLVSDKDISHNKARRIIKIEFTELGRIVYFLIKDLKPHNKIIEDWIWSTERNEN